MFLLLQSIPSFMCGCFNFWCVCFLLGQKGFSVYKSVPYGPVGEALAYLARRASENRDVIQRTEKERSLLWLELRRRMTLKPLT